MKRGRTRRRGTMRRRRKMRKRATMGAVQRMVGRTRETKTYDNVLAPAAITVAAPQVAYLLPITKGVNRSDRIADQVDLLSMKCTFNCGAQGAQNSRLRIMIFFNKAQAGLAALTASAPFLGTTAAADYHWAQPAPFIIPSLLTLIYDKSVECNIMGGATDVPRKRIWKKTLKLHKRVQYNDLNGGTAPDVNKNALYCMVYSDIAGANPPIFGMQYEVRWKDA